VSTQEGFSLPTDLMLVVPRLLTFMEAYDSEPSLTLKDLGLGTGCRFLYPRQSLSVKVHVF